MLSFVIILLSGCGYHLAGKAELDPVFESSYISHKNRGHLIAELLRKQFDVNGIKLVAKEEASALVEVLYERREKDILSVDEEGKVREYELILMVGVDVRDAEGKKLMKDQNIRLTRDFLFDIDDVLGKGSEENKIYQEMREDVARLILYRLQAVSSEVEEAQEEK